MCNLSDDKTFHVIPPNKLEHNTRRCSDTGRCQTALSVRHADNYAKFTRRRLGILPSSDAHTKRRVLSQIQLRNTRVHHGAQPNARRTVQKYQSLQPDYPKIRYTIYFTACPAVRISRSFDRFLTARRPLAVSLRSDYGLTRNQSHHTYISGDPRPFSGHHVHHVSPSPAARRYIASPRTEPVAASFSVRTTQHCTPS